MDFDILASAVDLFPYLAAIVLYIVAILAIGWVTSYFYGWVAADLVVCIVGFPVVVIVWCLGRLYGIVSTPWRHRNRRLLRETFGIERAFVGGNQEKVDRVLASLAYTLQKRASSLAGAREQGFDKALLKHHHEDLRWARSNFDRGFRLARKNGYQVRGSYINYL